jgi:uncharacterized protein YuzE
MKFVYDKESDSLFMVIADRPYHESEEVLPGIVLDFDAEGNVIGIELEHASKIVDVTRLPEQELSAR